MIPIIVTNNPRVKKELSSQNKIEIIYMAGQSQEEILRFARDKIHLGAKLIVHPMMGRIKPHETPYKSVLMEISESRETQENNEVSEISAGRQISESPDLDYNSVMIIEDSILETSKLLNNTYAIKYDINDEESLKDLAYIDYLLMKAGLDEYLG